jgi:hypothetical protein
MENAMKYVAFMVILVVFSIGKPSYADSSHFSSIRKMDSFRAYMENTVEPDHRLYMLDKNLVAEKNKHNLKLKWRPKMTWTLDSSELTIGAFKSKKDGIIFWDYRF